MVIAIIGVLTAVAVSSFLGQRDLASKVTVASDLANAAIVLESYGAANGGDFSSFPVASASNGIRGSGGNVITVTVSAHTYAIKGTNGSLVGSTDFRWYGRSAGGLQAWGASATP